MNKAIAVDKKSKVRRGHCIYRGSTQSEERIGKYWEITL